MCSARRSRRRLHGRPPIGSAPPASLAALARRAGLAPVRDVHLSLEHSPVTLTQTWINRVLGGDNRLFRSLTYDDEPDAPRGRVPLPIHFAAAAACLPFAVLVS